MPVCANQCKKCGLGAARKSRVGRPQVLVDVAKATLLPGTCAPSATGPRRRPGEGRSTNALFSEHPIYILNKVLENGRL
jgi:hypothetical protein